MGVCIKVENLGEWGQSVSDIHEILSKSEIVYGVMNIKKKEVLRMSFLICMQLIN